MSRTSPPYSPSPFHKMPKFFLLFYHSLTIFSFPDSLAPYATLKLERGRAHHSRGPQQFSCWPASVACVVVLASRRPLKRPNGGSPTWRRPAGRPSVRTDNTRGMFG